MSSDALLQEVDGEGVILDLSSATYFGLNSVGVRLWQMLGENPDLQAACDTLLTEYEVEADQLEKDIDELVDQLVDAGLARIE